MEPILPISFLDRTLDRAHAIPPVGPPPPRDRDEERRRRERRRQQQSPPEFGPSPEGTEHVDTTA